MIRTHRRTERTTISDEEQNERRRRELLDQRERLCEQENPPEDKLAAIDEELRLLAQIKSRRR